MIRVAPNLRVVGDDMQAHVAAQIFPMMEGADFDALMVDIKANGQREPIVVHDGLILDGRNRYRACRQLGLQPVMTRWEQRGTAEAFVISMNLHRRHLNESQRAMIAAKLAKRTRLETLIPNAAGKVGLEVQKTTSSMTAGEAAELLNIGRATVFAAKKVLAAGTPEEIAAVEEGQAGVNTVARQINGGASPERRKARRAADPSQIGRNPERIQRMQMQAEIWAKLSDALLGLTSLPLPADVAEIINANPTRRRIVDDKLARSLQWLKDFEHACRRD